jgi:hypothetical protein
MRKLPPAVCVALILVLASSDPFGALFVGRAQGQTQDDLHQKCRRAVFLKYGEPKYGDPKKIRVRSDLFIRELDQCVASRGRTFPGRNKAAAQTKGARTCSSQLAACVAGEERRGWRDHTGCHNAYAGCMTTGTWTAAGPYGRTFSGVERR